MMSRIHVTGCRELLTLRPGVYSAVLPDGGTRLVVWQHAESFGRLSTGQEMMLRLLAQGSHSAEELYAVARDHDRLCGDDRAEDLLRRLRAGGWLTITVTYDDDQLYTLHPLRQPPGPPPDHVGLPAVLSRFAVLRRDDHGIVVESPYAWCDVRIDTPEVVAVLAGLSLPGVFLEGLRPEVVERVARDLRWAGIVVPIPNAEDTELRLSQWSPHDLWLHDRSRAAYRSHYGATRWAKGHYEPLPARHPGHAGPVVDLHRPDLARLRRTDPTLTTVLEDRRSVRVHDDDQPLTAAQLGEFLYRCARNRGTVTVDGVEYLSRPYPAGGSVYELELYPVVRHVTGLATGMYHYDAEQHRLRLVGEPNAAVRRLLRFGTFSFSEQSLPQVLIVIAARFGRVMWIYESMAYALILKHVGVLYQTMYSVATAMGLAPCGLGGGDSTAFVEATGLDPFEECSVGEFILGSRRSGREVGDAA